MWLRVASWACRRDAVVVLYHADPLVRNLPTRDNSDPIQVPTAIQTDPPRAEKQFSIRAASQNPQQVPMCTMADITLPKTETRIRGPGLPDGHNAVHSSSRMGPPHIYPRCSSCRKQVSQIYRMMKRSHSARSIPGKPTFVSSTDTNNSTTI